MGKVLIIIPAFNEERKIAAVVRAAKKHGFVLVINDGSKDGTEVRAMEAGAEVVNHPVNLGYGQALATGYVFAMKNGFDCLIQLDGDGQHDPGFIPLMLQQVEDGADLVIGSRFLGDPGYRIPFCRRLAMRFFSAMASRKCGVSLTDTTSGFRAMNMRAVEFCLGPAYDAKALVLMCRAGLRLREVPVRMRPNYQGRSMHSGIKPIFYVFKMFYNLGRG